MENVESSSLQMKVIAILHITLTSKHQLFQWIILFSFDSHFHLYIIIFDWEWKSRNELKLYENKWIRRLKYYREWIHTIFCIVLPIDWAQ